MGTHDAFTSRLSDYLDDEDLSLAERSAIDAHLAGCEACRTTLVELRQVVARASTLPYDPPAADLWPGVASRLPASGRGRVLHGPTGWRFTFTLPQLVAASLALMLMSGGAVWIVRFGGSQTDFEPAIASQPVSGARPASFVDPQYDEAIADLERALDEGRSRLDPETIRVLEQNLTAIDHAIEQSRRALEADPFNAYLNGHLAEARKQKLSVLRRATALAQQEG